MCAPFMPLTCPAIIAGGYAIKQTPKNIGNSIVETVIAGMASAVEVAVEWTARLLTLWVLVPSSDLCPTNQDPTTWAADWVQQCNDANLPAQQLRSFLLPIAILVACGGLLWQAINVVVTRKGEPLMQAVRGIWTTALWSAIGIAAPHALLKATDSYSMWVLDQAIFSKSAEPPNEAMSAALVAALVPTAAATGGFAIAPFVVILIGIIVMIVTLLQTIMMVFREGSLVVLAGTFQLAAAGTLIRAAWLQKVISWSLALACYKAAACTVYAATFAMMGGKPRDFVMGLAMLVMSIVALPVLLKFFSHFTGSIGGGGGMGMAGAGAAAGIHAASSMRGAVGGNSAGEHARYMETNGPGGRGGASGPGSSPSGAEPTPPSPGPGSPGGEGGGKPGSGKVIDGETSTGSGEASRATSQVNVPAGTGATAPTAASGTASTAGASTAGASTAGATTAGATTTAATTSSTGAVAGAGAAGGPVGLAVAGAVVVGKAGYDAAKQGSEKAGSAMDEGGSR